MTLEPTPDAWAIRDVRVVIVDDHPVVRTGLVAMLDRTPGITVVGEAADGDTAVAVAIELHPDVVVMDLNLPGCSGETATAAIRASARDIGVLVLTMESDDERMLAALQAGARGYLLKGAEPEQLIRAIHDVARGDLIVGDELAQRLAEYLRVGHSPAAGAFPLLTGRERQVLVLMAAGVANPEIARRLDLRPKTVRNHVSNILVKLQARDRTDAILRARAAGLGNP